MTSSILLPLQSFRLLLYLEWLLLGIAALSEVRPEPFDESLQFPLITILSLTGFGLMGLRLPTGKSIYKVIYTGLEIGLISLPIVLEQSSWLHFFPLLCLVMVIRGCLMFRPLGRLIVAALAFVSFLIALFLRVPSSPPRPIVAEQIKSTILTLQLNIALSFGLTLVFLLLLINALLAERQSREKLIIANSQLRLYALRIEDQATLQERNRIAREIHDSLGHSLTAQSIQLENALIWQSNADKAQKFLIEAKRLGADALQEVRQSIATLRSTPLQGQSLEYAIRCLVKDFSQTTGILPECKVSLPLPLTAEVSTAIYRIVQELLTNICKHATATKVTIQLYVKAERLYLLVEDNGKGFNPDQNTTGFGLQGMLERAVALLGQFRIVSRPGAGCKVVVYIPLPRLSP